MALPGPAAPLGARPGRGWLLLLLLLLRWRRLRWRRLAMLLLLHVVGRRLLLLRLRPVPSVSPPDHSCTQLRHGVEATAQHGSKLQLCVRVCLACK